MFSNFSSCLLKRSKTLILHYFIKLLIDFVKMAYEQICHNSLPSVKRNKLYFFNNNLRYFPWDYSTSKVKWLIRLDKTLTSYKFTTNFWSLSLTENHYNLLRNCSRFLVIIYSVVEHWYAVIAYMIQNKILRIYTITAKNIFC